MKRLTNISIGILLAAFITMGCESMFDVNSDRILFEEDNQLDSPNDTIFSMVGILSQLQKLGDRHILLGELRGDLLDVTDNANLNLLEINNFEVSAKNPYNNIKDYYAIINNCNYLIKNIDTSLVVKAEKVMYKEFAAAKGIRAWTYMQLVLNYGSAKYYENPILTVADANVNYPEVDFYQLADLLIADLEPFKTIPQPGLIALGDMTSYNAFFPIRFLLGDLYMWKGDYERAATEYHALMYEKSYVVYDYYQSTWTVSGSAFSNPKYNWNEIFVAPGYYEQITSIAYSSEKGKLAALDSLFLATYEIAPSNVAISNWKAQTYYHDNVYSKDGDLRGEIGSWCYKEALKGDVLSKMKLVDKLGSAVDGPIAFKLCNLTTDASVALPVYRIASLYLRYAEAVNRLNKPNLAFATLKHGLNIVTLNTTTMVPSSETIGRPEYMNFNDPRFRDNIGVHARGCGFTEKANAYKIPSLATMDDSVKYVEDLIVNEYALECAFEGNRFQDLMRVALRRGEPAYLADKVAAKHKDNSEAIRAKLMDTSNWYLPTK